MYRFYDVFIVFLVLTLHCSCPLKKPTLATKGLLYSRVPNKRRSGNNGGGGWKLFNTKIIGGVGIIGEGVLGKAENSRLLT